MPKELTFDLAVPDETILTFNLSNQPPFLVTLRTDMSFVQMKQFERVGARFDQLMQSTDDPDDAMGQEFNAIVDKLVSLCVTDIDMDRFHSFPTFVQLQIINRIGMSIRSMAEELGLQDEPATNGAAAGNGREASPPPSDASSDESPVPLAGGSASG